MSCFPWGRGNTAKALVECHLRDAVSYAPLSGATVTLVYLGPTERAEREMEIVDEDTGDVRYFATDDDVSALPSAGKFPCRCVVTFQNGTTQDYPNEGNDSIQVSAPL